MKIWMIGIKHKFTAVITWVELTFEKVQWEEQGNHCLPFGFLPFIEEKDEN